MGFYGDQILPRCLDFSLSRPIFSAARARVAQDLTGEVLELGFGSGLNLPFYPRAVTKIHAVDPSQTSRQLARKRLAACPVPVVWAGLDGQRLELPDSSIDAVLSTFTLCSIPDLDSALTEVKRVLKPGGRLHFLEHGRSPDGPVARWQDRLDRLHGRISGGCHLNRAIADHIRGAGFCLDALDNYYLPGPKVSAYMFEGRTCVCSKS